MLNINWTLLGVIGVVSLLSVHAASGADDGDGELVELTNPQNMDGRMPLKDDPLFKDTGAYERKKAAEKIMMRQVARNRAEMDANGFVVVSDAGVSTHDQVPSTVMTYQLEHEESYESIINDLGYAAMDLNQTPFQSGSLLGMMPARFSDGRIHEINYVHQFEDLGTVILEEISTATMPDGRISISKWDGKLSINGNEAGYTVLINEKRDKGMTLINIITKEKMFNLTVLDSVLESDKRYPRLMALAESLY